MKSKVEAFINALQKDNTGVEAVALYQNGETVIEHHFIPSVPRCIYSHTKSFVATAAGIAIGEGKLSTDTTIMSLFPEYEHIITDDRVYGITLKHFLTMSSGFGPGHLMSENRRKGEGYPDYVGYMLSKPMQYPSGERFAYSNGDTHMAGCMVQRAVGEPLLQYLYNKLFSKLGIGFPGWETDPDGTAFGGSGLYLDISNMMKLGILYLNDGVWEGERILSSEWVKEASSLQISTGVEDPWSNGYGYQFWLPGEIPNCYRADGAYGQYSIVLPDKNAVLAVQSSEHNRQGEFIALLHKHVFD